MNIKKQIQKQAIEILKVFKKLEKRDRDRMLKLNNSHKEEILYNTIGYKVLTINLILFNEKPFIEEYEEKTRYAQACYKENAIAINYECFRSDNIFKVNDEMRLSIIRHELGHLYEFKTNNDLSEEAANKYE